MVTLEQAKKTLHDAETLVAKLTGEEQALAAQVAQAEAALRALGVNPDAIDEDLAALDREAAAAETELRDAMVALQQAMGASGG